MLTGAASMLAGRWPVSDFEAPIRPAPMPGSRPCFSFSAVRSSLCVWSTSRRRPGMQTQPQPGDIMARILAEMREADHKPFLAWLEQENRRKDNLAELREVRAYLARLPKDQAPNKTRPISAPIKAGPISTRPSPRKTPPPALPTSCRRARERVSTVSRILLSRLRCFLPEKVRPNVSTPI